MVVLFPGLSYRYQFIPYRIDLYALCLTVILFLPIIVLYISMGVTAVETGLVLSGLLGLFLLICAYAAIGLFMSSLTSYQVVAAIATLSALALFNFIGTVGQEIAFIREITYWLSINGRASNMVAGLICSDDVIYFLAVIGMFLGFSILRIQDQKIRLPWYFKYARYILVLLIVVAVGYISSRPKMMAFYDTTHNKRMTLSVTSQEIVNKLDGPLTITTFCNILDGDFDIGAPKNVKRDQELFKKYLRFKPEIKLEYVYYYAPPVDTSIYANYPGESLEQMAKKIALTKRFNFKKLKSLEEVEQTVDLKPEEYRFVRMIERGSGERSFLRIFNDMFRQPGEAEISAALKKLIVEPVKVGFLVGHGERDIYKPGDRDYSLFVSSLPFRGSMINRGFDLTPLNLENADDIAADINMLIIADMRESLSQHEEEVIDRYIARGDNIMILADARRQESMNPLLSRFGVELKEGVLVQPSELFAPVLITAIGTDRTGELSKSPSGFWNVLQNHRNNVIIMNGVAALDTVAHTGYNFVPLLTTNPELAWLDLNLESMNQDKVTCDSLLGERKGAYLTVLAAIRKIEEQEQRVMIFGDADFMSNSELLNNREGIYARNMTLIPEAFSWLSNGEFPVRPSYPPNKGTDISLTADDVAKVKIIYVWVIPAVFVLLGFLIWFRRRGR